ncbi:MAG TPA: GNAT family N-acetyltransferase [Longimicrobiales bacterium]|nr:GNAT family N-acetyltransferase [Longimicrobiales bacterium]
MSAGLTLRAMRRSDVPACLRLFDGHVPGAFVPEEREEYRAFLSDPPGPVLVLCDSDGEILAAGGVAAEKDPAVGSLCWGIVDAARQRAGLGRLLLLARVVAMFEVLGCRIARLETLEETAGFFGSLGFETTAVRGGGHPGGRGAVEMRLELTPDALAALRARLDEAGLVVPRPGA